MIQVEVEKNLICMEDLATGIGTVSQSRGGTDLTLTKVNAAVFPYSDTQTVAQKINDLDAKYDYVIANTSTSFSISTLVRKSGNDLIDTSGSVFTPQVVATSSAAEASYPAKLWVKIISATEHHLKRGADLLAKFNPVTHAQLFDLDYATIVTNVLAALGLGTAAYLDTGTSANNVVKLDGSAKLPAVDGSQLTNLPIPITIPVGGIAIWPLATAPINYVIADGALLSRTTYATLFAVYGETYGAGDGSTTFGIPDYRGIFVRGNDNGRGLDNNRVLGSYQDDAMRKFTGIFGNDSSVYPSANSVTNCFRRIAAVFYGGQQGNYKFTAGIEFDNSLATPTAIENRPKNTSVNYIIRYQ